MNYSIESKGKTSVPLLNTQCFQNSAESGELSVLTLGSQVPCAYPAMCGIQCKTKKRNNNSKNLVRRKMQFSSQSTLLSEWP